MSQNDCNVLRVNSVEEQAEYRKAVSTILLNVQRDHGRTLVQIADDIDVSLGTVSNAANQKADLNSIYLKRLGAQYGPSTLDPYAALYGARMAPLIPSGSADILPMLSRAGLAVAEARDPLSDGGAIETHREKLGYLPHLRALRRELDAVIGDIEGVAA